MISERDPTLVLEARRQWSGGERSYWNVVHEEVGQLYYEDYRYSSEQRPFIRYYDIFTQLDLLDRTFLMERITPAIIANMRKVLQIDRQEKYLSGMNRYATQEQRMLLWLMERGRCGYCHEDVFLYSPARDKRKMNADHIVPYSIGGLTIVHNMVCSCQRCNIAKQSEFTESFMNRIATSGGLASIDADYNELARDK